MFIIIFVLCFFAILGLILYIFDLKAKLKEKANNDRLYNLTMDSIVEKTKNSFDKSFTKSLIEMNNAIEFAAGKGWCSVEHRFDDEISEPIQNRLVSYYKELGFQKITRGPRCFYVSWSHKV